MLHRPPPLKIEHARLPIEKVELDPNNPRLIYKRQLFQGKSAEDIIFQDPDTNWLLKDIEQKGILDPIYVMQLPGDTYKVTEGNRRTTVMKALHEKHRNSSMFSFIPARILPSETSEEQEALLMASFHVAGKVKWEPHEKAGQIWRMLNVLHIHLTELTVTLHMSPSSVKKAAESYALLEHFKRIDGGAYADKAEGKWSFFAEMLKIKDFSQRHAKGQEWDDQFCRWVGEKRLQKSEDVRELAEILKKTRSRIIFETGPVETAFQKAKEEVDKDTPSRNSKFFKALESITLIDGGASLNDVELARNNEAARDSVLEAYSILLRVIESAELRPRARS